MPTVQTQVEARVGRVAIPVEVFRAEFDRAMNTAFNCRSTPEPAPSTGNAMTANDLTFGIEIECYLKNNANGTAPIVRGGYHNGVQIADLPAGWNAQSDGSLYHVDGYYAVEIVSPILRGRAGIEQVKVVCEWLKQKEAKVTDRCGFHVHVGLGRWLTVQNVNKLVMLVKYWESALYAITGTVKREAGGYCKARPDERVSSVMAVPTVEGKATADERMRILNLTNLSKAAAKRTVEFRLFSGTTSYVKMAAYIQVALGMVQAATGPIGMKSLKMRPEGKLKTELANGRYTAVVRELVRYLWRIPARPGNSKARGVLDPENIMKCKEELSRLAKKYQAIKNRAE